MNKTERQQKRDAAIDRLRRVTDKHGLNKTWIAEQLGVSREHLTRVLNQRTAVGRHLASAAERWLEANEQQYS